MSRIDIESDKERENEILARLLFRAAFFMLIAYTILISIRLAVAPAHTYGLIVMSSIYVIVVTTMLMAHYHYHVRLAGHLFLSVMAIVILFRSYVAGGSDSPVLITGIMVPIAAIFLLGRIEGLIYAVLLVIVMGAFSIMRLSGYEFPDDEISMRLRGGLQSVVVIFVMAFSTWVAWLYARHNESLTGTLLDQSRRDHLTGIPNRRAFDFALEKEIKLAKRQGHPLTLFMVDLDYFKSFNDLYGHHEGDQCLINVANIIQSCLRRPGDMVARYGGEEFAVILPDTELPQAVRLAETMRHAVVGLNIRHEKSPHEVVTITLGVSDFNVENDMQASELITITDEALYAGKEAGRNRVEAKANN